MAEKNFLQHDPKGAELPTAEEYQARIRELEEQVKREYNARLEVGKLKVAADKRVVELEACNEELVKGIHKAINEREKLTEYVCGEGKPFDDHYDTEEVDLIFDALAALVGVKEEEL